MRVHPYLNFNGNCEAAFEFYRSVFGGEFSALSRYSEMPGEFPGAEAHGDLIMHMSLPLGDGYALMGADRPPSMGEVTPGDDVHLNLAPTDAESARRIFDALSDGGQVTMPLERTFWGADFGMCIDRFGVHWMVNYDPNEVG
jgi:PhnB protein